MNDRRCAACMCKLDSYPVCRYCGYDARSENAAHQLPQGTVLKEQYLVGKVLGQGGFGITYLGWDQYLDIPVAVKEYFPSGLVMRDCSVTMSVSDCSGTDDSQFRANRERFLREAKVLARFSQIPEIVQVRNFFLANNTAYIVMEYVEGLTLKKYVQQRGGKLSVEETFRILRPLMAPLARVHKAGIVHRDISPDNIMMLPHGGIKLLDFGAVRDVGALGADKSTQAILRPGFAPIEQYQKRGDLGPWTDVYALCGTMYFCMTGEVPVDAPERILGEDLMQWRELVPELTDAQEAALRHGMALRAENRCRSVDELYAELFAVQTMPQSAIPVTSESSVFSCPAVASAPSVSQKTVESRRVPGTRELPVSPREEAAPGKKPVPAPAGKEKQAAQSKPKPVKNDTDRKKSHSRAGRIKLLSILAVFVIALVLALSHEPVTEEPGASEDQRLTISGSCGDYANWDFDPKTGRLSVTGSRMTQDYGSSEEAPWSAFREEITAVEIGEGITGIGSHNFSDLPALKTAELAGSVEIIGANAFSNASLQKINLQRVHQIHREAFLGTNLKDVELTSQLNFMGEGAFFDCDALRSVSVGADTILPIIRNGFVFSDRNGQIPEDFCIWGPSNCMAEVYARAYGYSYQYNARGRWDASGTCGKDLTWYYDGGSRFLWIDGQGAMPDFTDPDGENSRNPAPWMEWCHSTDVGLENVIISDSVTSVGDYAFAYTGVRNIRFGNKVRSIGSQAFLATALETLDLPESVMTIESYAFNHCSKLTRVVLPENLKKLDSAVFNQCLSLERVFLGADTQLVSIAGYSPFNHAPEPVLPKDLVLCSLSGSKTEAFASEKGFAFQVGYLGMEADDSGQLRAQAPNGLSGWFKSGDTLVLYGDPSMAYNLTKTEMLTLYGNASYGFSMLPPPYAVHAAEIRNVIILWENRQFSDGLLEDLVNVQNIDFGTCYSYSQLGKTLENRESLETVTVRGTMGVPQNMFRNCKQLREVTVETGDIAQGSFTGCSSLDTVRLGQKVTVSGDPGFDRERVTLYVFSGSQAEKYARENGLNYIVY